MTDTRDLPDQAARRLRWPLRLTFAGLLAERAVRAFWPFWTLVLFVLAALMLGVQDMLPLEAFWAILVAVVLGGIASLVFAGRRFHWPTMDEAADRLDQTMPDRPISAITDSQAIGQGNAGSEAVWKAHVARMADRLKDAKAPEPDLKLASRDRYGLRYMALVAFVVALLFGSLLRVASVAEVVPGSGQVLAEGPSWEGWVEPPIYTGRPSLYLNDIDAGQFRGARRQPRHAALLRRCWCIWLCKKRFLAGPRTSHLRPSPRKVSTCWNRAKSGLKAPVGVHGASKPKATCRPTSNLTAPCRKAMAGGWKRRSLPATTTASQVAGSRSFLTCPRSTAGMVWPLIPNHAR